MFTWSNKQPHFMYCKVPVFGKLRCYTFVFCFEPRDFITGRMEEWVRKDLMLIWTLIIHTSQTNPVEGRVFLGKLTFSQLLKNSPVYETEKFITMFTRAWTCSCHEPDETNPQNPIQFLQNLFKNQSPIYAYVFQVVSFRQAFPPNPCMYLSPPLHMLHAALILMFSLT